MKVQARIFEEDPSLLLLEVSDTGCRNSPDMTERIFELLFQNQTRLLQAAKALAWGCILAKSWLRGMADKSGPGAHSDRGAVFSVTLPFFLYVAWSARLSQRKDIWKALSQSW